jgi:uncharacterized protein
MLYVIIGEDEPGTLAQRLSARPAHLARLDKLRKEGNLIVAGPFPAVDNEDPGPAGFTGSLIIAEFPDLDQAQTWASQDPYVITKVYKKVSVKPFKKVFP